MSTVGELADVVRSKNAGPFWVTLDLLCDDPTRWARLADESFLTPALVSRLYGVPADLVQVHRLPSIGAIKISYPRPVSQAGPADRDVHSGQQFVLLAAQPVPDSPEDRT